MKEKNKSFIERVNDITDQSDVDQAEEYERSILLNTLNEQISGFKKIIEESGFKIKCSQKSGCAIHLDNKLLSDGKSFIILDPDDNIEVVEK